jgi:hypothetical protein
MNEKSTAVLEASAIPVLAGTVQPPSTLSPPPIVLVVEASTESAAREHFAAVEQGRQTELFELSRGLLYAQAQESGRYWKFELSSAFLEKLKGP